MEPTDVNASVTALDYWRQLATDAEAGTLHVTETVARQCDDACATYLAALAEQGTAVRVLAFVDGMGGFDSGKQLARKFSLKASGGNLSLDEVLRQHVEVVKAMQDFFRRFFTDVDAQDSDNASLICAEEPR